MVAPSSTKWGSEVGSYGKIGIYTSVSNTATKTTLTVDVYLWTKYSCSDSSNNVYFDNTSSSSSATTNRGSKSIKHTVASGDGWSTSNQTKIYSNTYEYTRTTSDQTRYLYAKMTGIDRVGGTMTVSTTVKVPKLATYTITFNANGGSGGPTSQTKTHGTALTLSSSKPTKTGYKFLGWSTSSSATSATWSAGGSYTTNASDTLYAVWTPFKLTVKYNANGGTVGSNAEYPISTHTNNWKYGDTGKTLINFSTFDISKTGYDRKDGAEWNTKADGSGTSFDQDVSYAMATYAPGIKTADTTITVYAQWTPKKYTITFNPNGGSGGPTTQTKTYGTNLTLSSSKPTRSGYTFKGWSTSKTANSATYTAGATFSTNITANTTLYAVWQSNYTKPKISNFSVTRWGSNSTTGAAMDGGPYVRVRFNWSTFNDVTSITILCNDKTTTLTTSEASGKSGSVDKIVGDNVLAEETTYPITVTVTDSGGSIPDTKNAVGASYPIDFLPGGKGCAIGKASTESGTFEVNLKTKSRKELTIGNKDGYLDGKTGCYFSHEGYMHLQRSTAEGYRPYIGFFLDNATEANGQIRVDGTTGYMEFLSAKGYKFGNSTYLPNNIAIFGADENGSFKSALIPQNYNGNTIVGYGNYDLKSGDTNVYGHDINFGISNIASPDSYRPYRRMGDSVTLTLRTAGYVTNSGKDVSFWIPFAVPIVGSPTATITSGNGFVLRQGDKYTHGSSASANVTPASYEAVATPFNGVYVKAVFSNTTNVTNNDAIGIYWHGTITFS